MDLNENMMELPTERAKETLEYILKHDLMLKDYGLEISPGSAKGDNYLGIVYRVKIIDSSPKLKEKIGFIIKMPPMHPQRREQFFARPSFLREILVYEKLIPLFDNFQREKDIDVEIDGFHHVPKCYKCIREEYTEGLFMEDLMQKGFQMYDRCKEMSIEHALVALKALAKFHAVSFAIKDQCIEREGYKACMELEDIWIAREHDKMMQEYQFGLSKRALNTLDPETDKAIYERVERVLNQNYMESLKKVVVGNLAEPYAIVCHGDFWNNNVLYRYKDDKPVEAYLLDYQIVRYASPATDLVYYLFTSTSGEFRNKYWDEIIKAYYETFSELLKKLGSDPEKVFPENILQQHLKQFGMFGVLMAILLLPIFVAPSEEAPDMEEAAEKLATGEDVSSSPDEKTSQKTLEIYAKRMKDVLYDACKYDIIPKL